VHWTAGLEARIAEVLPGARARVVDAGLACCALEVTSAALRAAPEAHDEGIAQDEGAPWVLVVSGTITDRLAPSVLAAYESLPAPESKRFVMSFGACSNTGGPYWDSYVVLKGVDQIVPVDVYVPGCPPRPEALMQGLELLGAVARQRMSSGATT